MKVFHKFYMMKICLDLKRLLFTKKVDENIVYDVNTLINETLSDSGETLSKLIETLSGIR